MGKRRKTRKPVTRRVKKALRRFRNLKKIIQDPILKQQWDEKKTAKQNLDSIPLTAFAQRTPETFTSPVRCLPQHKEVIMRKLMDKYGHDCVKMARDIQVNVWQWTPTVCKSYIALLTSRDKENSINNKSI